MLTLTFITRLISFFVLYIVVFSMSNKQQVLYKMTHYVDFINLIYLSFILEKLSFTLQTQTYVLNKGVNKSQSMYFTSNNEISIVYIN